MRGPRKKSFLPRRLAGVLSVTAMAAIAAIAVIAEPAAADSGLGCRVNDVVGSFGAGKWPGACWRPYSDTSPFNLAMGPGAPVAHDSSRTVRAAVGGGDAAYIVAGDPKRPDGIAVYYSKVTDPVYRLHCTEDWGTCPIEGMRIHVPEGAQPAGGYGTDAHMTIVDQWSGWEYDLWAVTSIPRSGGTLRMGFGGRTRIDGSGLDSYAVAARFGSLGGLIRPQEMVAGHINHALQMFVPCTEGFVYPADHPGLDCSDAGMPSASAPAMGARFRLATSVASIRRHHYPTWKRAILVALHRYGAYVADTSGDETYWGFRTESSASYTSFGKEDPMVALAKRKGMKPDDYNHNGWGEYWFDLNSHVDWSRLELMPPCTARDAC
jgi:hypothetical protein